MRQLIFTTSNFIVPAMIVFLAFLAFFLYPRTFVNPGGGQAACTTGKPPSQYKEVNMPSIVEEGVLPEEAGRSDFVLVRENMPISTDLTAFCPQTYNQSSESCAHFVSSYHNEFPNDLVLYPRQKAGEHNYFDRLQQKETGLWLWGEKLLFVMKLNGVHNPKVYSVRPSIGEHAIDHPYEKILLVDVYQEKGRYEAVVNGNTSYNHSDIFQCDEQGPLPKLTQQQIDDLVNSDFFFDRENPVPFPSANTGVGEDVMIPAQSPSTDNQQLQLEWFVFTGTQGVWGSHCKPAVYLYPPQKMQVNVKVYPAGFLTYTDPQYDMKDGWTVDAYPDGTLTTNYNLQPTNYPYLYFESKVRDEVIEKPTKGWVVKYEELPALYQDILPKLGLNGTQTKDFSDYWNKALQPAPYYFVGIIEQSNVDEIERLEITPKPDSINRVRVYFERLDAPKEVEAPEIADQLISESADSLFRVVEWGGMVKNDPNHPFTCSQ